MDTARLRVLRMFPQVQSLLSDLITYQKLVPEDAQRVSLDALNSAVKSSVLRAEKKGAAWYAWSSQNEFFAISATLDEPAARVYARPVLAVLLYDGRGRVMGTSQWLETQPGQWTACH